MPTPIVNLFKDNKQLGLRVWCTCLAKVGLHLLLRSLKRESLPRGSLQRPWFRAKPPLVLISACCRRSFQAYLENSEFLWSDFTGREAEDQKEPILMTV